MLFIIQAGGNVMHAVEPMNKPLKLQSVSLDKKACKTFERVTAVVKLDAAYTNPYYTDQVRLDAIIKTPSGNELRIPGFYFQDYTTEVRTNKKGKKYEVLVSKGDPCWQVRYAPAKPGTYEIVLEAVDTSGRVQSQPFSLTVEQGDAPGMTRIDRKRPLWGARFFVTDDGKSFFPIGYNIYGAPWRNWSADMSRWLTKMGENGCNFCRVWMYYTFYRYSDPGKRGEVFPYDHIDQGWAWRYDRVMDDAARSGLRIQLCLDTHHPFLASKGWGLDKIGLHKKNGGPVTRCIDFFSNAKCKKAFKARLRYVAARYGWDQHVFAWEFWNEIGGVPGVYSKKDMVRKWHTEMAAYLRKVDNNRHLITSSAKIPDNCPGLDFSQPHIYGAPDPIRYFDQRGQWKPGRQVRFFAEAWPVRNPGYPAPSSVPRVIKMDPKGQWIHDYCFSSPGLGLPATPMIWYHSSYIDKENLYPVYKPFSKWVKGFDFAGPGAGPFWHKVASTDSKLLNILGFFNRKEALVWIQNRTHAWEHYFLKKKPVTPVKKAVVTLKTLTPGTWTVAHWDTYAGKVVKEETKEVGKDRTMKISIGPVEKDIGLRLTRQ